MTEYLWSIVSTVWGLGGVGLALATVGAVVYLPRVAPFLAVAALLLGAVGYVDRLKTDLAQTKADLALADEKLASAEEEAAHVAATAQADADAAKRLAADNEAQAQAYEADAAQARSDVDQIDLARQAAAIAANACKDLPAPVVGDAVHSALTGRTPSEDDPLAPSMKAAMEALSTKPKGRRR